MFDNDIAFTIVVTTLLILLLIAGVIITMFLANRRHVQQEVKMALMQSNYEKELRAVENHSQGITVRYNFGAGAAHWENNYRLSPTGELQVTATFIP